MYCCLFLLRILLTFKNNVIISYVSERYVLKICSYFWEIYLLKITVNYLKVLSLLRTNSESYVPSLWIFNAEAKLQLYDPTITQMIFLFFIFFNMSFLVWEYLNGTQLFPPPHVFLIMRHFYWYESILNMKV